MKSIYIIIMKNKLFKPKKFLQALAWTFVLVILVGGHVLRQFQADQPDLAFRAIELSSIRISQKKLKKEKDIRMIDPAMSQMWGLQSVQTQEAWKKLNALGSRHIKVAIIDTGIDRSHPDLEGNLWVNPGEVGYDEYGRNKRNNDRDDDNNGCIDDVHGCNFIKMTGDITDNHGHGTHVAGIIGAIRNNGIGISGVSPKVSLMVLKYYDPKTTGFDNLSNTVKAIYYAIRQGAHIINYSGGGISPSYHEKKAIELARKKGVLFITAAGNEKSNLDAKSKSYYPADYSLSNIVSVTAFDKAQRILPTSNYGAISVDIAAPGNNIFSTLPGGKYGHMTGTSQATAFVTGVAALIMSQYRDFEASKVIKHLTLTGDLEPNLIGKTIYRRRLNTYRALAMLDQGVSVTGIVATNTSNMGAFDSSFTGKKAKGWGGNNSLGSLSSSSGNSSISSFGKSLYKMIVKDSQMKKSKLMKNR